MKRFYFLLISALLFYSCASETTIESHQYSGEALGTTYNIRYFSNKDLQFERSLDSIIAEINASMSTYITKSDISRVNRGDTNVKVDENFVRVFKASEKIYKESNGFFDPTVGVLVNAYGFGPGKPLRTIDSSTLDSLKTLVGFNKISLKEDRTIQKKDNSIYLDFNAIAKGYTIDVIAEYLNAAGIDNYLIELGGELRAKGKNVENKSSWVVGIDDPNQQAGKRELKAKVKLENAAMATSGNYRKFRTDSITGEKYVHTINPITGRAERSNLLSASVIAGECMLADGYATAFMALGLERTKEILNELEGIEVYILYANDQGEMAIFTTPGFENKLVE